MHCRRTPAFADKRTSVLAAAVIVVCAVAFGLFAGELYFAAQKLTGHRMFEKSSGATAEGFVCNECADILT